jgi:hypothetical protein
MRYFLIIAAFLVGCGPEIEDKRRPYVPHHHHPHHHHDDGPSDHTHEEVEEHEEIDHSLYKVVGRVTINAKMTSGQLYATATSITYTSTASNTVTLNESSLNTSPSESSDGESIDLGELAMSVIKVNNLKQCNPGGNTQCTSAIIRTYTNDISGHANIGGFVNKTESYKGGDIKIKKTGDSGTDSVIGHLVGSALTLSSYTIPANDKKLTASDFTGASQLTSFPMEVDFSNAGVGDYEASIEIEVALGPSS